MIRTDSKNAAVPIRFPGLEFFGLVFFRDSGRVRFIALMIFRFNLFRIGGEEDTPDGPDPVSLFTHHVHLVNQLHSISWFLFYVGPKNRLFRSEKIEYDHSGRPGSVMASNTSRNHARQGSQNGGVLP